ncbi:hypothetical protein B0A48_03194 [Cryoendolithus antarcticus]|uniref:Glycoside hydrolase family 76 protein n=1 Tax=Cryoendolithus antarcticus TaxID=1507870 RepID=A0A1V8TJC0_9PEZI|nr:hypothetical protein B0A48_03194 [Cryoendolithus antarcticus]
MQTTYWNGTYWPGALQWVDAFLDTLLIASVRSLTNELQGPSIDAMRSSASKARRQAEIETYLSQVEAYYGGEDTIQIFDAAYDDAQWVVLEWLTAIRLLQQYNSDSGSSIGRLGIARFAHRARLFYNIVQDEFDTSLCDGGITWNPTLATYKNAITNELFISSSIAMYLYFPGDEDTDPYPHPDYLSLTNITLPALPVAKAHDAVYLENTINAYAWFKSHNFTNAQGLIVDGFHLSDNQTTCDKRNEMVYTYNQGVVLSGLRGLWEATGEVSYLVDGYTLIATVINATGWNADTAVEAAQWSGLGRNGIMEDYCDAPASCSQDSQIFKGIYYEHLDLFCEPLPTGTPLVVGVTKLADADLASSHAAICLSYLPWIEHNALAALQTRNDSAIVGGWWGASYVNHSQSAAPYWTAALPTDSWDERNQPWVLSQTPWACRGLACSSRERRKSPSTRRSSRRRNLYLTARDRNDKGRGRTVETQGSGLGVVKAANDFSYRARVQGREQS